MNRMYRLLRPILDPGPVSILFVAGLVLMSAIGNAVYEIARNALGTAGGVGVLALGIPESSHHRCGRAKQSGEHLPCH